MRHPILLSRYLGCLMEFIEQKYFQNPQIFATNISRRRKDHLKNNLKIRSRYQFVHNRNVLLIAGKLPFLIVNYVPKLYVGLVGFVSLGMARSKTV
jgi:hypothetical protein